MLLSEFMENFDVPFSRYDGEDDQTLVNQKDTRKTRLTLRQIHMLRQMKDIQTYEKAKEVEKIQKIYRTPVEQSPI